MDTKDIKNVAIYLRKSREKQEEEDTLRKHRETLIEYSEKHGWNYVIYEEVISGKDLYNRTVMNLLIKDIIARKYDGLLLTDLQRVTRGDTLDFGEIMRALTYANCYFITPTEILDPNDKMDKTFLRIQGAFSALELDTIIERYQNGKKAGARAGRLTNGNPPFPYYKQRKVIKNEKGYMRVDYDILVDPEKRKIYDKIKEMYMSGNFGTERIAIFLNQQGYQSPGGGNWSSNAVQRLLLHSFHMGVVIYGKYEWKKGLDNTRKSTRKRDENEWTITRQENRGNWEQLKTEEEHQKILQIIEKNNKVPDRAKQGVFPTSSLMYCRKCGYAMKYSIGRLEAKTDKIYNYTKCNHRDAVGNTCKQRGVKLNEEFYDALHHAVITGFLKKDVLNRVQSNQEEILKKKMEITDFKKQLEKQEIALSRIKEAYLAEVYNLQEFGEEKKKIDAKIKSLKKNMESIEKYISNATSYTKAELENKVNRFTKQWKKARTAKEKNDLLKSLVKHIFYNREGNHVTLEIDYI